MRTDNNGEALSDKQAAEPSSELEENTVNWLLDMDLSEPEEKLFALDHEQEVDTTLTEEELAVARRPMTRGSAGADDLESYIGEEIVISSDSQGSDIYNTSEADASSESADAVAEIPMAVDYSREDNAAMGEDRNTVSEGSDILGLSENDDIGEKFLVIKRVKSSERPTSDRVVPEASGGDEALDADGIEAPVARDTLARDATDALSDAPVLRLINTDGPSTGANDETDAASNPNEMVEFEATNVSLNQPSADESDAEQPTDTAAQLANDSMSLELELELVPLQEDTKPADGKLFQIDES
ncbi:MAG: hypothetical protein AAGF35_12640, partial [Pseudomonadota bacterium]